MGDECPKHNDCMERIHDDIGKIQLSNAVTQGSIETFVQATNSFLNALRKDIYEKDGIMVRTGKSENQLNLQWTVIILLLIAVVGAGVAILFRR